MSRRYIGWCVWGCRALTQPILDPQRRYFDKWQMYRALLGRDIGPCSLPATDRLTPVSLDNQTREFGTVYVKPLDSWGGHHVWRVTRAPVTSTTQRKSAPSTDVSQKTVKSAAPRPPLATAVQDQWVVGSQLIAGPVRLGSAAAVWHYITRYTSPARSIIQQAAPVRTLDGRPFDIRVHMQRDAKGEWVCAGMLARVGGTGSVVSNVEVSDGQVLPLPTLFKRLGLPSAKSTHRRLRSQARAVGTAICRVLDSYYRFAEVGIDLGLAEDNTFWLFEVNTNDALGAPSHELFLELPDTTIYKNMLRRAAERHDHLTART